MNSKGIQFFKFFMNLLKMNSEKGLRISDVTVNVFNNEFLRMFFRKK